MSASPPGSGHVHCQNRIGCVERRAAPSGVICATGLGQRNHDAKDNQEDSDARNPQTRSGKLEPFARQVILVRRHLGNSLLVTGTYAGATCFRYASRRATQAPRSLNQRAPRNSSRGNAKNVPQFRGAIALTSVRDTRATVPAQGQRAKGSARDLVPQSFCELILLTGTLIARCLFRDWGKLQWRKGCCRQRKRGLEQ